MQKKSNESVSMHQVDITLEKIFFSEGPKICRKRAFKAAIFAPKRATIYLQSLPLSSRPSTARRRRPGPLHSTHCCLHRHRHRADMEKQDEVCRDESGGHAGGAGGQGWTAPAGQAQEAAGGWGHYGQYFSNHYVNLCNK